MSGLADEARLANARLPDDPDDLALPPLGDRCRAPKGTELGGPAHEARRPPASGHLLETEDSPDIALRDPLKREAPRQERRHGARDDDGARRVDAHQSLEERPRGRLAVHPDQRGPVVAAHEMVGTVNGEDGGHAALGHRVPHRHRGQRRVARGVVDGLQAEDGDDARGARLLDASAEGADLVGDQLQGPGALPR